MSIWQRLLHLIGLRTDPGPRTYTYQVDISESLQVSLSTHAAHEGRSEHELASDIFVAGLTHYFAEDRLLKIWKSLKPREQDVAALACLGYTNRQIGARLNVSPETVKVRLRNVLARFGVTKRSELRLLLEEWDFTAWENIK